MQFSGTSGPGKVVVGKVYFSCSRGTRIGLMKDDMSGFAQPQQNVLFTDPDHNPKHNAAKCEPRGMNDLGHEGVVISVMTIGLISARRLDL